MMPPALLCTTRCLAVFRMSTPTTLSSGTVDWMSGTTYIIQPDFFGAESSFTYNDYFAKNLCSGTHGAYMNLIEGKTDVIIASRDISRNEKASAAELGVELVMAQKPSGPVQVDVQVVGGPGLLLTGELHGGVAVEIEDGKSFSHWNASSRWLMRGFLREKP